MVKYVLNYLNFVFYFILLLQEKKKKWINVFTKAQELYERKLVDLNLKNKYVYKYNLISIN